MTDACAAIVERDDPHLYATALFAPEPARSRLMVLYAFDCELSRASRASRESMIPRMRLQWWRDVIDEAEAGAPPKSHEVAAPLHGLARDQGQRDSLREMVRGHQLELDPGRPDEASGSWDWRETRFQALITAAAQTLRGAGAEPPRIGPAMADAFALRHAARMAHGGGRTLMPQITGLDLSGLARGILTEEASKVLSETATRGLDTLKRERSHARVDRNIIPALLPTLWVERTLRLVQRDPTVVLGQLDDIDRPFDGLRLAWRAARGRW